MTVKRRLTKENPRKLRKGINGWGQFRENGAFA